MISSMMPYSLASGGGQDLVALDVGADLFVGLAGVVGRVASSRRRIRWISAAWISRSDTWP